MTAPSLTDFLLARIAEDDEAVRVEVEVMREAGFCDREIDSHSGLGDWGPARVLAECEAKRRIVERLVDAEAAVARTNPDNLTASDWQEWGNRHAWHDAACLMAATWSDHPDYQPEWRA